MSIFSRLGFGENKVPAPRIEQAIAPKLDGNAVYREFVKDHGSAFDRYFRDDVEAGRYEEAEAEARRVADAIRQARPSAANALADTLEQVAALDPNFQGRPLRAMAERLRAR